MADRNAELFDGTLPPLVAVTWEDSAIAATGWVEVEDLQGKCDDLIENLMASAGYLVLEEERYVVVCASVNPVGEQFASCEMIPRSAIRELRRLVSGPKT